MAKIGFSGGEKLQARLEEIAGALKRGRVVRVGFMENASYPDGTAVAMVAAVNEFGGSINVPARTQDLNFKVDFNTGSSRFAKADKANFAQTVTIPAHTVTIPPRPFFRNMIDTRAKSWGTKAAKALKHADYNTEVALGIMGELISGQLQESIRNFSTPPNAPSTIAKKGFNKPLIDTGFMLSSVSYEVRENA